MLGCTVLNHQQHIGLQKLSALAGVTHSSLGPNKHYKFIQDDFSGESALVCSCFRILQNLELTCAVGQLVYETIRAHRKLYHTGSGCLLFLAGAWARVALECLQRGITVGNIILAMSEGMDLCLDVCRRSSVSIKTLGATKSESSGLGLHPSKKPKAQKVKTLKLSRHFCEAESENVPTEMQPHQPKHSDISHIAEGLSHGCADAMNLVIQASRIQSRNNQDISCSAFDIAKVVTCLLPGAPEDTACVLPGCVVLLCPEQASLAHHLQGQHLRVALINGDLSYTYCHLGFKTPKGLTLVSERSDLSSSSKEEEWVEKVVTHLLDLDVQLILVSGLVGENLALRCCSHCILVVGKVQDSALKAFAKAAAAVPVTYATQLSKHCVGTGVDVVIWRELSGSHDGKLTTAVNICTAGNSELVTVVLTSCVHAKLQALEDQFWACAYRLHHVLKDNVILPGGGVTEMLCVHHLHKHAELDFTCPTGEKRSSDQQATPNPYRGVVLHLMAEGLIDYISTVMVNTGRFSKVRARTAVSQHLRSYNEQFSISAKFSQLFLEGEDLSAVSSAKKSGEGTSSIYDCLSVKQEAWRKALDLVFLVLQTDAEVITGIDQKTDCAPQNAMLL